MNTPKSYFPEHSEYSSYRSPTEPYALPSDCVEKFRLYLIRQEYASSTVQKYAQIAGSFFELLPEGKAVTKEAVLKYKSKLLQEHTAVSVNGMLAAINCFLRFLELDACIVKPVRVQSTACRNEERELTEDEYCRLLSAAKALGKTRLYHLIETICSTGIRVSEVQYITVEAVRAGRAEVHNKGKTRIIFLPKALCAKLRVYCAERGISKGSVFVTRTGKPLDRSNIWAMMKRLCSAAKVEAAKVFPHNLRHLFARVFYEQRHDLDHLAVILGHSSINTTRIYTQTSEAVYQRQIELMRLII